AQGNYGTMVAMKNNNLVTIPLKETSDRIRFVEPDHALIVKAVRWASHSGTNKDGFLWRARYECRRARQSYPGLLRFNVGIETESDPMNIEDPDFRVTVEIFS
ncbi:MAG: hypothetical protein AB7V25_13435, partial [Mangrovibacterium sp.]